MNQSYQNKLAYNKQYNKKKYKSITFRLDRLKDADLVEYLDDVDITSFLKVILREHKSRCNLKEHLTSREHRTAKLGSPYALMELDENRHWREISGAEDLESVKILQQNYLEFHYNAETAIIKRYMNKYGTIVAMKVRS